MKKINKFLLGFRSLVIGMILIFFSLSKLTGAPQTVEQFEQMAKPIGLNPTFFRSSTGLILLIVAYLYIASGGIDIMKIKKPNSLKLNHYKLMLFTNIFGVIAMFGALGAEFFLRTSPKYPLVFLSSAIIFSSIANLKVIVKHVSLDGFKLIKVSPEASIA